MKNVKTKSKPCIFFDRDGIVNESPGPGRYVLTWEDFHLIPAFVECLRIAARRGYQVVVVTNQRCVARGLISHRGVAALHRRLQAQLRREYGLALRDIVYCPHDEGQCTCRKPQPGMLMAMARKHGLDLARSWMVGDAETDVEAGRRAGCRTIRVGPRNALSAAEYRVGSMSELPALLETVLC